MAAAAWVVYAESRPTSVADQRRGWHMWSDKTPKRFPRTKKVLDALGTNAWAATKWSSELVGKGAVKIAASRTYALRDAPEAHRELEARKTTGSVVLLP